MYMYNVFQILHFVLTLYSAYTVINNFQLILNVTKCSTMQHTTHTAQH